MNEQSENGIHVSLHSLAFPINKLDLLPGNPRRGDVDAVIKSYQAFGQRKPIVARMNPDGERATVIAGNTQLKAATQQGWSHIAVTMVDDDDKTAAAFAIADNRTHDLGEYDDAALVAMIDEFKFDNELLLASGYDLKEYVAMEGRQEKEIARIVKDELATQDLSDVFAVLAEEATTPTPTPTPAPTPNKMVQYTIVFTNEEQQAAWFKLVRWLKTEYEDLDTLGERLEAYVDNLEI